MKADPEWKRSAAVDDGHINIESVIIQSDNLPGFVFIWCPPDRI
jgi:hypothetical protein